MKETQMDIARTALLVIDMQNDLINSSTGPYAELTKLARSRGIIDNTARVIAAARRGCVPVIYSGHVHKPDGSDIVPTIADEVAPWSKSQGPVKHLIEGTRGADFIDQLKPAPGEHVIWKYRSDAFFATNLELILRSRSRDTVIITGVVTNGCIAATIQGARHRDLNIIIVEDCLGAIPQESHDYFIKNAFPRIAQIRSTDEIVAALAQ